jgi:ketosteroid isomerase-like protein
VSRENVEVVRRAIDALNRFDVEVLLTLMDPEIEMDWTRRLLDPTVVGGHAGVRAFVAEISEIFSEVIIEEEEAIDDGDQVVIVGLWGFTGRGSEVPVTARAATVWTVRDRRVVHFAFFQTRAEALEAVGLRE